MRYKPETPPQGADVPILAEYLSRELARISDAILSIEQGRFLPVLSVAPQKPRDGMLAIADGTNWNPGSGKGLYEYRTSAWYKL